MVIHFINRNEETIVNNNPYFTKKTGAVFRRSLIRSKIQLIPYQQSQILYVLEKKDIIYYKQSISYNGKFKIIINGERLHFNCLFREFPRF